MDDPHPIVVTAMILCDGVARDEIEEKTTVVGCTSGFIVPELPTVLPSFAAFIMFSEVTRRVRLDFQILNGDNEIIYQLPPTMVDPTDALTTLEFDPRFANVEINAAGYHFIRLLADGIYIIDLRFNVTLFEADED